MAEFTTYEGYLSPEENRQRTAMERALMDNVYMESAKRAMAMAPRAKSTPQDSLGQGPDLSPIIDKARAEGAAAERERIMAALQMCKPTETAYSRRDWAIEERGKRDLWAKIMKAPGVAE